MKGVNVMLRQNLTKQIYNHEIQILRNNGYTAEAYRLCLKTLLHRAIENTINGKECDFTFFNLPSIFDLAEEEFKEYMQNFLDQYKQDEK